MAPLIVAADLDGMLNIGGQDKKFKVANQNADAIAQVLGKADAEVRSFLKPNRLVMFEKIPGYIFTKSAIGGETEFDVPEIAWLATTSTLLWVNLPCVYADRLNVNAVEYDLDMASKVITLRTALNTGDSLVGDIYHTGVNIPQQLKARALDLALGGITYRLPSLFPNDQDKMDLRENYRIAHRELEKNWANNRSVPEWDNLPLMDDTATFAARGPGCTDPRRFA